MASEAISVDRRGMDRTWPPEVGIILTALEAAEWFDERRKMPRMPYRVKAVLHLFTDGSNAEPKVLYTRDADRRSVGFVTRHRLPLGYGGTVELETPNGKILHVSCTLQRCRKAAPDWYEGSLCFNREQADFEFAPEPEAELETPNPNDETRIPE